MKKTLALLAIASTMVLGATAQHKPGGPPSAGGDSSKPKPPVMPTAPKSGPKAYKEVITDKAVSKGGLFAVHHVEDKWYFEVADSVLHREFMAITRFGKTPGGGVYGGEMANQQMLMWDKGPSNTLFLRVVAVINVADSSTQIYRAVANSNVNPIVAAFEIKALGKDSSSYVIDVTDFFKGDNTVVSIPASAKGRLKLGGLAPDRSYIEKISTFPINTEVRTIKTFSVGPGGPMMFGGGTPSAADVAGAATLELNTSFILLPAKPMAKRLFDKRVGFFADDYNVYGDDQQKVKDLEFIVRWRLEPRPEDMNKWRSGQLVEPAKPIVYYIDPATPKQWRPYLIQGINDWQKAFEKAGFKNAIMAKDWPEGDSTMSMEDARYSVLRYFASDIENAYGPNVHDPRSGEIIESHIGWYHNVMSLLHDWFMIQTAAVDPKARKMHFDDSLMGTLVRFVSSHEVGHTLGLRHNMGSSSTVPVEKLRDKAWLDAHGHTPSIMDYARFNYVAQPQDNIPEYDLFPRIGEYDRWAIQWGYAYSGAKDEQEDSKIVNRWIIDSLKANPRLWFGGEGQNSDARAQMEDLGENNMKANEYGIRNLQRILPNLPQWTMEEADKYENLADMYKQLVGQFNRYMGHVLRNVGSVYETFRSVEQPGDVYEPEPKAKQQEAVAFLNHQLFETPRWLLDKSILNKISNVNADPVASVQTGVLSSLLSPNRLTIMLQSANRFGEARVYTATEMISDVRKEIWKELTAKGSTISDVRKGIWKEVATKGDIDPYRRGLQRAYVEAFISILNPPSGQSISIGGTSIQMSGGGSKNTDLPSIARAELSSIRSQILAAIPLTGDRLSKYHLQDLAERIKQALDPK